jgi:hypothetical protein
MFKVLIQINIFSGPKVDYNGICFDEECQKLGYCKLKKQECNDKD